MTKFITVDAAGAITGMFDDAVRATPPDAIVVSDELFTACGPGVAYANGALVPYAPAPTLAAVQARQIDTLRSACAARILSGYVSSALGSPRTYPSGATDQLNMLGSVTASTLPTAGAGWVTPFWCADASGVWTFADHTAAQIQQAGEDGKAMVVAAQTRLRDLTAQVLAATTPEAVALIVWGG